MKYTEPCPVCTRTMEGVRDHVDVGVGSGPTCEDSIGCEGHYSYEFHYGSTRIIVGTREFGYDYTTPQTHIVDIHNLVRAACAVLKGQL